jgi:hypothetical protein
VAEQRRVSLSGGPDRSVWLIDRHEAQCPPPSAAEVRATRALRVMKARERTQCIAPRPRTTSTGLFGACERDHHVANLILFV